MLPFDDRSTKAGASTPATPRQDIVTDHVTETAWTRSTKAGASTPATPLKCRFLDNPARMPTSTLNQGRGLNPGDTSRYRALKWLANPVRRSTKAGASTPATQVDEGIRLTPLHVPIFKSLNQGRGLNPGDTPRGSALLSSLNFPQPRHRRRGNVRPANDAQPRPGPQPRRHNC